jgi:hypothetical protein
MRWGKMKMETHLKMKNHRYHLADNSRNTDKMIKSLRTTLKVSNDLTKEEENSTSFFSSFQYSAEIRISSIN